MGDLAATAPVLVWFRQDLRLADNPALNAAVASGRPVLAVYVLDDEAAGEWRSGGASRWWLHHSLERLAERLAKTGGRLILRRGPAMQIVPQMAMAAGCALVTWNRCYEPFAIQRDTELKKQLLDAGIEVQSFNGSLLREPWTVKSQAGGPVRVFTPFWRANQALGAPGQPLPAPKKINAAPEVPSEALGDWGLLPTKPDWAAGLRRAWTPGEAGAAKRLAAFLEDEIAGYAKDRDRPDRAGTSRLSPHLHFGEISPGQIWHAIQAHVAARGHEQDAAKFLSEVGWRDFSYNLLFHEPEMPARNLRADFDRFPWRDDQVHLRAWQRGQTGYPVVDAGMRQLWQTGWMHNRVRMVVASFLVKHLLIPWQAGEAWFWDTLVDADLASNAASWQWVAGCGADAAPYFRVFNPIIQGEKFDPDGDYVRLYVPELARLPTKFIHQPWTAPEAVLREASVDLGKTYPRPIVEHDVARKRALAAFASLKQDAA
jgi:deoxyribodipyrimidine photo-lyase